jgi:hypothetical protein
MPRLPKRPEFDQIFGEDYRSWRFFLLSCLQSTTTSSFLGPNILHRTLNTLIYVVPLIWKTVSHTQPKEQAKL